MRYISKYLCLHISDMYLSCGVGWGVCVHSVLQCDGMGGGTAAETPAGETDGTDCPENAGSSPEQDKDSEIVC